jgi:hypothetical protein
VERDHPPEAATVMLLRRLLLDQGELLALLFDERQRREGVSASEKTTGPSPGRRRRGAWKSLVEVDVHRIDAEVARADSADDRV